MADLANLELRVDSRKAESDLGRFKKKADEAGKGADGLRKKTKLLNTSIKGLTVALSAGVVLTKLISEMKKATQAALEFSKAMAEVSTLLPDSDDLEAVSRQVRQLSVEFNQSPVEQARALYQVISAGAANAAEAQEILTVANRLAVGGVTDVATAADGLTSILNAYGLAASEAGDVSDALFVAMKAGKTTIGELSASLGKVAPLAAQVGIGIEELTAATAALTKGGITTRESITGLRAIMAAVVKPTSEAVEQAKILGIEFNATALETQGLAGFMDTLVTATGGSTDQLAQLFGGVEALVPVLALAGQAGVDFNDTLDAMATKAGATGDAFDKVAGSDAFRLEKALGALKDVTIDLGNEILTVLVPAMELAAENIENFGESARLAFAIITGDGAAAIRAIRDLADVDKKAAAQAKALADAIQAEHDAMVQLPPTIEEWRAGLEGVNNETDRLTDGIKEALTPWQEFQEILKEIREEAEALKRANLKESIQFGGGIISPTGGPGPGGINLGPMLTDLAEGQAAYAAAMAETADEINPLLSSLPELAGGFSRVGGSIGEMLGLIASGFSIGAIAGGFAQVISALIDTSERDRIEREHNAILERNTQSLQEMAKALAGEGTTQQGLGQVGRIAQIMQNQMGSIGGAFTELFAEQIKAVGLPMAEFDAIVKELGITLRDSAGRIIPGALDDLIEKTKLAAEALEREQGFLEQNIQVRALLAQGLDEEAEALRQQIANEKELADARIRGLDVTSLIAVQELEAIARDKEKQRLLDEETRLERERNETMAMALSQRAHALTLDDDELAIFQKRIQQQDEMNAALEAGFPPHIIAALEAVQASEMAAFIQGLADAAEEASERMAEAAERIAEAAARAAEAMERFRQSLIEDIRVRELFVAGREKEAQLLQLQIRQQKELATAIENQVSAETLDRLTTLQEAERERLRSQLFAVDIEVKHTEAIKKTTRAIKDTTAAANQAARVLNAPQGLRLSLLRWRASQFIGSPSLDTRGPASTSFNFGKESVTIQAAEGESGESLLNRVLDAANRRARVGTGNVFTTLPEDL